MAAKKRFFQKKKVKVPDAVKKYVKRAVDVTDEAKRLDTVLAGTVSTLAGTIELLSGIVQGTQDYQRVGNLIRAKSLMIRFLVTNSAANDPTHFRVVIFQYKQAAQAGTVAAPIASDILQDSNAGALTTLQSGYHNNNQKAVHILLDKYFPVSGSNAGGNPNCVRVFTWKIPEKRLLKKIQFIGTGGTVASTGANAIYILTVSGSTNNIYSYKAQLEYTDA